MTANWNMLNFTVLFTSCVLTGIGVVFGALTYYSATPDKEISPVSISNAIMNDDFLEGCALTKVEADGTRTCLLPHLRLDTP